MRTTITLEPDVEALVKRVMSEREVSFKVAVNETLRAALTRGCSAPSYRIPTFRLGEPRVDLTHANRVAAAMEDEEIARQVEAGR